jgi:hypothetical protein
MKSKLLLLSFLMLFTFATNYAQITATTSSVAIQGIARDDNGNARTNQQIPLTLELYYNVNGTETAISTQTVSDATTDAFGVFSTLVDIDKSKYTSLAANQVFLRISGKDSSGNQDVTISDQAFNQVPYAVVASNGVPTGSIMPFIGTVAPIGWALCDGAPLPTDGSGGPLSSLLGDINTPNLQGMFLRGAGGTDDHIGPELKKHQDDGFKAHLHDKGTIAASEGKHSHKYKDNYLWEAAETGRDVSTSGTDFLKTDDIRDTNIDGGHEHVITGNTGRSGGTETRPVNYGVNYIIKL